LRVPAIPALSFMNSTFLFLRHLHC
jgi:hypothetical protein